MFPFIKCTCINDFLSVASFPGLSCFVFFGYTERKLKNARRWETWERGYPQCVPASHFEAT